MANAAESSVNRIERARQLAFEVIDECRVQLMMKFRFLDVALWKMDARPAVTQGRYALATDGTHVYYEPYTVIGRFDAGFNEMVRDYLHLIMHCLFRHPFDTTHGEADAWWLVCDVVAENAAMDLCGERFACDLDVERRAAIKELTELCNGRMTPGNLYGLFLRSMKAGRYATDGMLSGGRINELRVLFERDFHKPWPSGKSGIGMTGEKDPAPDDVDADKRTSDSRDMFADSRTSEEEASEQDVYDPAADHDPSESNEDSGYTTDGFDEGENSLTGDERENDDTEDPAQGSDSGEQQGELSQDAEREAKEERSEEQDWEELAKRVEMDLETFSKEWGFEAGNFVKTLTAANRKKVDYTEFLRRFVMRGFGGTDFRPAFSYVNRLIERGELPDMKGVIYFTDGLGEFPEKAPAYDVAFVFMDEGGERLPKVPPWAMRILIDEAGIERLKSD